MKKFIYLAMFVGLSLASVQCTKTVEERIVEHERTNTILSGSTAPTATIGNVGDYYIDLTSVNLYGPKTTEGWGTPISLRGLQGQNGTNGQNGQDAPIPHIGDDGYWYIGNTKTTVKAQGNNGSNGETPHIGNNGNWFIGNRDLGVKAKGEKGNDGETPRIGDNGNWFVGNRDLGIKAKGEKGNDGQNGADAPKPNIKDGYWYIGNVNTNIKAQGERGLPGKDGSKIYAGQGNPPANTGREGDYYIDTENKIFYGPKTNTGWPSTGISLSAQQIITTDYELSPDGKTLLKWKNPNTRFIDMNADPKLKEVEIITDNAFNALLNNLAYELRTFVIGDKVKEIGKAFYLCTKLTSVEISNENITREITKIKTQTFVNCTHLQNVDIPSSVTTIETRAFIGCDRLTTMILPEKVNNIKASAFMKCKNLHTVIIHNPNVFTIDNKAFNQTLLRNIYVPSGQVDAYKTANPTYQDLIK